MDVLGGFARVDLGGVDKVSATFFFNMGVNGAESLQVKGRGLNRKGRGHF